ncbi:SPOR domain-containing protein [Legionella nagasakiensis]|uniref:SPOR domain-containing protein n=1 Tax=Legionella nagasakiensis TaxID=535290 RepID=UPI001056B789|nr:SPOR domain-containing protein [Legionella nagasakiensis]
MLNNIRIIAVLICTGSLAACVAYNPNSYMSYPSYAYDGKYPENYESTYYYGQENYRPEASKQVVVPESYHVGPYHSPASHKDRDRRWVVSQNPQGYTIELAHGEKASQVAGKLYKAPKNDRMAEIKYQQDGKTYYQGLYGSYSSYEAAQQALGALPDDLKQGASIKSWGNVQNKVNP